MKEREGGHKAPSNLFSHLTRTSIYRPATIALTLAVMSIGPGMIEAQTDYVFDPTPVPNGLQVPSQTPARGTSALQPGAPEAPGDTVDLILDDDSRESGIASVDGRVAVNIFTPNAADFPLLIEEVSVVFVPAKMAGEPVDIYLYEDSDGDGDLGTGGVLLASLARTILVADGQTASVYSLDEPILLADPTDVAVAVAPRTKLPAGLFVSPGLDTSLSQARSWEGVYSLGEVADPPVFPADSRWGLIDNTGNAGNWMIRVSGTANVIYDQLDNILPNAAVVSQNNQPDQDAFDSQVADDFIVDGRGWVIEQIQNVGFYNLGPGPADSFNIAIAPDDNGAPSAQILCNYPSTLPTVDDGGALTLDLAFPCSTEPGTYWLMIQANLSTATPPLGGNVGQYRWNTRSVADNMPAKYREPNDGSGLGCTDWTDVQTCFPTLGPDVAFRLSGTLSNLIFEDSFETMDTSAWSSTAGAVAVVEGGIEGGGDWKLEVPVDGTSTKHHVQSSHPIDVETYTATFLFDANSVDLGTEGVIEFARVFDQNSLKLGLLSLRRRSATNYKMLLSVVEDSGATRVIGQVSVGASGATTLELQWETASSDGANDGVLRLLRNGNVQLEATDLDTDEKRVGAIRIGAPKGSAGITGAGGVFYLDEFTSIE